MKISAAILRAIPFLFLVACSGSKEDKGNKLTFKNDLEGNYWSPSQNLISFPQSHSGNFVNKLETGQAFSNIFNIRVKDISSKPVKRAKVTAWFMLTGTDSEQNLVLDVRDSTMQNSFEWINVDATDFVSELNKWGKVELIVDLTLKNRNSPDHVFRIYAANGRKQPVYVDDFEISFEE